ncbi:MAG: response regulator [Thermoproteota archaeon]
MEPNRDNASELQFLPESKSYCVCCIDIANSTSITAGLSEEQVRRYYSVFLNTVSTIVKSYDAIVIKTLGDGMLYYMPNTENCKDVSLSAFEHALECCFTLLNERHPINRLMNSEGLPPLSYRVSADYGRVQIAAKTNDLFGSTVNTCSKINRFAKPDGMVIGSDLYRIVHDFKNYRFTEVDSFKMDKKLQYPVYAVQHVNNGTVVTAHISPVISLSEKDRPRVMVVDDEDDILILYRTFLSNSGYSVDAFNDAERALIDFAKSKEQYALVILDVRMPKINGLQLFYRMKAINAKTSIMFVTALDAIDEIRTVLPDSNTSIIKKPVTREQFISKVKSMISQA